MSIASFIFLPLLGFSIGIVATALLRKFSQKYNILNIKGIPHIGGAGMGVAFFIAVFPVAWLYKTSANTVIGILAPSILMLVFGIIDDKKELSVRQKLLGQIIAVGLLVIFGVKTNIVNIGWGLNLAVTFIWMVGITNAFNHLDIMDGLAAGVAFIVAIALFIVTAVSGDMAMALLSLSTAAVILSFLVRNFPRAHIYMGNCGSHFLGFILAAIAVAVSYAPMDRKTALVTPILIMGLPIFDTAFVTLVRMLKGRSALMKSNDHLAMRFLRAGYSQGRVLFYLLSLAVFLAVCGILMRWLPNHAGLVVIGIAVIACSVLAVRMAKVNIDG